MYNTEPVRAVGVGVVLVVLVALACNAASTPGPAGHSGGDGNGGRSIVGASGADNGGGHASGGTNGGTHAGGSSREGAAGSKAGAAGSGGSSGGARPSAGASSAGGAQVTGGGNGGSAAGAPAGGAEQAGDVGAAGAGCDDGITVTDRSCLPAEETSTQTVYFDVTNAGAGDVYLVTSGQDCTAYGIHSSAAARDLVLRPFDPVDCPCGLACDSNTQSLIQKLAPGATQTLSWDARDVLIRNLKVEDACDASQTITEIVTVRHRVSPGEYSVSLGYYLPPPCEYCGMQPTYAFSFQPQCAADQHAGANFTLPAAGDVRVPVTITDP
jgi:hypothetical protein